MTNVSETANAPWHGMDRTYIPSHSVSGLAAVLLSVTQSLSHSIIQSFSHSKLNSSAPSRVSTYIPVSTTVILSAPSRVLSVDLPEYYSSFKCAL